MKKNLYKIISFILVILWMIAIFWLSSMSGDESNYKSKKTIDKALPISAEVSEDTNTTNTTQSTSVTPEEKQQIVDELNRPLRKFMHANVYFVLAILLYNLVFSLEVKNKFLKYAIPLIIVFIYACSDEYHQTFVAGRTGEFTDVLIDTFGGIIALVLIFISTNIMKKLSKES